MALLLEWGCDEATGTTATDSSGNGRNGVVNAWATGHTGSAAVGSSTASAVTYTGTVLSSPTTWSAVCWYKPNVTNNTSDVISIASADGNTYAGIYWATSTKIVMYLGTSGGYVESSQVTLSTTAWSHIAVTVSSTQAFLYIGGTLAATVSHSGSLSDIGSVSFGGHTAKNQGTYDDIRMTNTTLTSTEVTTYMNTPVASSSVPTITTSALTVLYSGFAFSQTIAGTNSPTSWAVSTGTLPAGLSLNTTTGTISGLPTATGGTSYSFALTATNGTGSSTAKTFSGTILTRPTPVVEWPADEGSGGVAYDSSGNGRNGITARTGWVAGHDTHEYAASGDASSPGVMAEDVTLLSGSATITLMSWVKAINWESPSGDLLEVKSDHDGSSVVTIYRPTDTTLRALGKKVSGTDVETTPDWAGTITDTWLHIAVTLASSTLKLFVNGTLAGSVAISSSGNLGNIQLFYAGGTETKPNQAAVNDVRMFSTALSDAEIPYWMNTPAVAASPVGLTIGDDAVTAVLLGDTPVTQIWAGDTKIYG